MGLFNQIFGGSNIYPSQPTYLSLNPLSASTTLSWPIEQAVAGQNVVADLVDVNATVGGLTISLSDARQVSQGYTSLFNNIGANTFTVLDAQGNTILTVASGTVWQIYLADNTTLQGTWRAFQYGVGTSSATAAALAGAGLLAITTTLNQNYVFKPENANYTFVTADRAVCVEWTGGTGTGTLPTPGGATAPAGWFTIVKNAGTGVWTISPPSGAIDGGASLALSPKQSCFILCDGTNFFTLGLGQTVVSVFDFVQVSLAGQSGNFTLAGVNLNRVSYKFTGAMAGNTTVIVPTTIQQYWVDNETTGGTLTISTGSGTTYTVPAGTKVILYSDGQNIVTATSTVPFIDGSAAVPSISFLSDLTMGLYKAGTDILGISTAGVSRMTINATGNFVQAAPSTGIAYTLNYINGQDAIKFQDGTIQAAVGNNTTNFFIGTDTAHGLFIYTQGIARLSFSATGAATFGTSQPVTLATAADNGGRGVSFCRFKANDTSRTNTVVSADPDLQYAITAAGTYAFELLVTVQTTASGVTPGFQGQVNYSGTLGSAANRGIVDGYNNGAEYPGQQVIVNGVNFSAALALDAGGGNLFRVAGTFTATTAGTFSFQWAQNSASGTATTVRAGSSLTITQVS